MSPLMRALAYPGYRGKYSSHPKKKERDRNPNRRKMGRANLGRLLFGRSFFCHRQTKGFCFGPLSFSSLLLGDEKRPKHMAPRPFARAKKRRAQKAQKKQRGARHQERMTGALYKKFFLFLEKRKGKSIVWAMRGVGYAWGLASDKNTRRRTRIDMRPTGVKQVTRPASPSALGSPRRLNSDVRSSPGCETG